MELHWWLTTMSCVSHLQLDGDSIGIRTLSLCCLVLFRIQHSIFQDSECTLSICCFAGIRCESQASFLHLGFQIWTLKLVPSYSFSSLVWAVIEFDHLSRKMPGLSGILSGVAADTAAWWEQGDWSMPSTREQKHKHPHRTHWLCHCVKG